MNKKKITFIAAFVFLSFFAVIVFIHANLMFKKQVDIVNKHASVVASAVWNFDPEANKEYLIQVVAANDYEYVNIYSAYDDLFSNIKDERPRNIIDSWLVNSALVPSIRLESDVKYNQEKIGRIEVLWQPRYVYKYFNYFLVGLLLYALFYVWLSLVDTNKNLDKTIKERTDELAKTKSYLNNVVNSMPSVLIGIEPDGTVTEANKEAANLLGLSPEEIKGDTIHNLVPQFEEYLKLISECIEKREPIEINRENISIKGNNRVVDLVFYPLVTNGVQGAVIRLDDVGLKVRFEEMMVQSEKMLSVGGLAAGMAHEINNPLGAILQGMQNIRRRLDPKFPKNIEIADGIGIDFEKFELYLKERDIYNFLVGIQAAGERAAKIVSNMLQFSRKSGSDKIDNELEELIESTIELASNDYDLKKSFDFRHIDIVKEFQDKQACVYGVRTEIEQVLLNLLKNSAHALADKNFTDEKPRIKISTRNKRHTTEIVVEDNGTGISDSVKKRMFDPFFTTKPVGIGTGLGLSISYFIVAENHKGKIDIESVQGQWTKIVLSFPKNPSPELKT